MIHKEQEPHPQIDHVVFDCDSTLSTIEAIDELARRRGMFHLVEPLTQATMNGTMRFEDVFFRRLDIIQPTKEDVEAMGHLYCQTITPGAHSTIQDMHRRGIRTSIVSGGFRPAVDMLADELGIPRSQVYANEFFYDAYGRYRGVNTAIPLWKQEGKQEVLRELQRTYPGRYALVGDSMGDAQAGELTHLFVCFAGVVSRPKVIERSRYVVTSPSLTDILRYI